MHIPRNRRFWAVALGHFTNDNFMSMAPVLLTFISANMLTLSTTQIGSILGISAMLGAVTQPFYGWLADKNGGRWLGAGGVAWTVALFLLAMLAAELRMFSLMVIAFMIPALGSGAFHPVGTKYAAEVQPERSASNLAYFFLMGQLGLALGPALSGVLLNNASSINHYFTDALGPSLTGRLAENGTLTPVMLLTVFGLPVVLFMLMTIPSRRRHRQQVEAQPASNGKRRVIPLLSLSILVAMVTLRSLGQPGAVNFIPVLFQAKGWSPSDYGLITSSFWIGSGIAGVFFGGLADRYDNRRVIALSLLASAPAFFLLPAADGALAFALAIAAGVLSGGSHSIIVSLAHELLPPGSKALASGMILGLIFGTGALGNLLIGWLGDLAGLEIAFHIVSVVTVLAALLAFGLPLRQHAAESAAQPAEAVTEA